MTRALKGKALVTGAACELGAAYADRLARLGHDLVLVARNRKHLESIAARLRHETGQHVEIVAADLNNRSDLRRVEVLLRNNDGIAMLVNGAGASAARSRLLSDIGRQEAMIALNVVALSRLTHAALPGLVARGGGTIINISSVPDDSRNGLNDVYGGTRAFVLAFSLSLHQAFGPHNMRIQAVLPSITAIGPFPPDTLVMQADRMVDAALAGLDQGEIFTTPTLSPARPNVVDWQAYKSARQKRGPAGSAHLIDRVSRAPISRRYVTEEHRIDGSLEGF